jgi:hypothetical protein
VGELEAAERQNAFAFDIAANEILPWAPEPNNIVTAMEVRNGRIWMAGVFNAIGSPRAPRNNVAVVNATNASLALRDVLGVPNGDDVFDLANPLQESSRKDLPAAGLDRFRVLLPDVPLVTGVKRIGVYGPNLYLSGGFSISAAFPRGERRIASGQVIGWQVTGGQQFNDVEGGSNGVFLAGFKSINGVSRSLLALVDG